MTTISNPTARWATIIDLEFLRTTGHEQLSESILRRKIECHEIAVATMDDSLIGYVYLDHLCSIVPFIATIWVPEAHRHKGTGKALLRFVETEARAQGQSMLYCSSQLDEAPPQAWHRHMGFRNVVFGIDTMMASGKCSSAKDFDNTGVV